MGQRDQYFAFARAHPEFFANPPGTIYEILLDPAEILAAEEAAALQLQANGLPREWSEVGIAYQDQYLLLLRDAVRYPNGTLGTYIRFVTTRGSAAPGVVILPMYHGEVVLLRHFRHATRTWHLELPRGFAETGVAGPDNAQRELASEIGGDSARLISLGPTHPNTGISTECVELFFSELASYTQPELDEAISQLVRVSVPEFERLLRQADITDGFTLMAYARAKLYGLL